ncbi:sperm flagellar protein 1 [Plakobranchus ocellatus]|uniref:Sperm flagellar protein 1 n=1 Tax=Plakobranchus ocellatus TaxID=259542 RepID=A0AAV3Z7W8_9GAST|nr:sperm flagellar protein 1 [Plakobranchus ocellatus]
MIAELINHFLPHLVALHNYTPANATRMKLDNWMQLNRKVFTKLNFQLTEDLIRELCLGKQGLVERFLMQLRSKIERALWDMSKGAGERNQIAQVQAKSSLRMHANSKTSKSNFNDRPEADQNMSMPNISSHNASNAGNKSRVSPGRQNQKVLPAAGPYRGNAKVTAMEETVSRALYEEKEQECLAKEETIQILQAKVRRLEHLLHLKDIRIEDLQSRFENTRPTGKVVVKR